jgi:polyphosphate glucokinase
MKATARTAINTLSVDCGGTGIKASVLSNTGKVLIEYPYLKTPYPLSPNRLISIIEGFIKVGPKINRVTVGLPGMIRDGKVVVIPHYINAGGPRTLVDPGLKNKWFGFDMQGALTKKLKLPVIVLNDAEVHGAAVITGKGLETVFTFGTGLGSAIFNNGQLAPHLEISHTTIRVGKTIDAWIGEQTRKRMGNQLWSRRVKSLIQELYPMIVWDRLYIGGGNAQRISKSALKSFDYKVTIIPNSAGVSGGVKAWQLRG